MADEKPKKKRDKRRHKSSPQNFIKHPEHQQRRKKYKFDINSLTDIESAAESESEFYESEMMSNDEMDSLVDKLIPKLMPAMVIALRDSFSIEIDKLVKSRTSKLESELKDQKGKLFLNFLLLLQPFSFKFCKMIY